ncbi:MAG: ROK family protein [Beutenbergiaceae bacterium]
MIDLGPGGTIAVVDVGGTEIKTAVLDPTGQLTDIEHRDTPQGPQAAKAILAITSQHADLVRRIHGEVDAVGLIVPGVVDAGRGVAVFSENLAWSDVPFQRLAAQATGVPVGFGHDVAAAGHAEMRYGAARECTNAAVLVVGTGIAAALFVDGKPLLRGGWAGEIGHSIVVPGGPACRCGSKGCLEAIASSAAIGHRYTLASGIAVAGSKQVLDRRNDGDVTAQQVWDEAIDALAAGIRQLAAIVSPEVVVIGGGLSRAGADLLEPLTAAMAREIPPHRVPQLRRAAIGAYAGLVGAALLGRQALQ